MPDENGGFTVVIFTVLVILCMLVLNASPSTKFTQVQIVQILNSKQESSEIKNYQNSDLTKSSKTQKALTSYKTSISAKTKLPEFKFDATKCKTQLTEETNYHKLPFINQKSVAYAKENCKYYDESKPSHTLEIKRTEADTVLKQFWLISNPETYIQLLSISSDSMIYQLSIYHFTWFGPTDSSKQFDYIHAASFVSAMKVTNSTAKILLHTNIPEKSWLENSVYAETVKNMVTIVFLESPPESIFGNKLVKGEHKSDVYRILLLLIFPGTYADLDMDMVVHYEPELIPNHENHNSQVHFGIASSHSLANGFVLNQMAELCDIASENQNRFRRSYKSTKTPCRDQYNKHLVRWLYEWRDFYASSWGQFSVVMSWSLSRIFEGDDSEVTVIPFGMIRPNWQEQKFLYQKDWKFEWKNHINVHLAHRFALKACQACTAYDLNSLLCEDSSFGEMMRDIYL